MKYYPTECGCCDRFSHSVEWRRRNTQYHEEEGIQKEQSSNWSFTCLDCHEEDEAIMADMWADYWSGRL